MASSPRPSFYQRIHAIYISDKSAVKSSLLDIFSSTYVYCTALYGFSFQGRGFHVSSPENYVLPNDLWAHTQIFSLSLIFSMWSVKHYRNSSFQQDCLDTLVNVAIPGTGIPLSYFFYSYYTAVLLLFVLNPLICLMGAINKARKEKDASFNSFLDLVAKHYAAHLFHPQDWFSFWRLNCILSSYHSMVTHNEGFLNEDKWHFLTLGKAKGSLVY